MKSHVEPFPETLFGSCVRRIIAVAILVFLSLASATCSSDSSPSLVKWFNLHENDAALAGVEVCQYPEGSAYDSKTRYMGKHPAMVIYYFWDGRVRQTSFEPNGALREDFFWPRQLRLGPDTWRNVNFNLGSDPFFKSHKDPRK